jgi:hypothetical protein
MGRTPAYHLLDLKDGDFSQWIVMGYSHDLSFRADGFLKVIGMGDHHLGSIEPGLQKGSLHFPHAARGERG